MFSEDCCSKLGTAQLTEQWIPEVAKAGGKSYTFHYEAVRTYTPPRLPLWNSLLTVREPPGDHRLDPLQQPQSRSCHLPRDPLKRHHRVAWKVCRSLARHDCPTWSRWSEIHARVSGESQGPAREVPGQKHPGRWWCRTWKRVSMC